MLVCLFVLLEVISSRHLLLACFPSPIFLSAGDSKMENYRKFSSLFGERWNKRCSCACRLLLSVRGVMVATKILLRINSEPGRVRGELGQYPSSCLLTFLEICLSFCWYEPVLLSDYWSLLMFFVWLFYLSTFIVLSLKEGEVWNLTSTPPYETQDQVPRLLWFL